MSDKYIQNEQENFNKLNDKVEIAKAYRKATHRPTTRDSKAEKAKLVAKIKENPKFSAFKYSILLTKPGQTSRGQLMAITNFNRMVLETYPSLIPRDYPTHPLYAAAQDLFKAMNGLYDLNFNKIPDYKVFTLPSIGELKAIINTPIVSEKEIKKTLLDELAIVIENEITCSKVEIEKEFKIPIGGCIYAGKSFITVTPYLTVNPSEARTYAYLKSNKIADYLKKYKATPKHLFNAIKNRKDLRELIGWYKRVEDYAYEVSFTHLKTSGKIGNFKDMEIFTGFRMTWENLIPRPGIHVTIKQPLIKGINLIAILNFSFELTERICGSTETKPYRIVVPSFQELTRTVDNVSEWDSEIGDSVKDLIVLGVLAGVVAIIVAPIAAAIAGVFFVFSISSG